jgi:Prokaryotic E2 family E
MQIAKAKAEIDRLASAGSVVELVTLGVQPFAVVGGVEAPCPPWDRKIYEILIAIPVAYDLGTALDGFYLALPYKFQDGEHNRVNGQVVSFRNQDWKAVSWHYPDGKPFRLGVDNIESHIVHCRGFFLQRGAINART